ncbi:helix-turn-helix domain-containing protein [Aliarcobacter butzleri]|uniref:helix-turn-helix domain-containing protein n=1 Tax=Aliarcobacter butzleri TaxID=28197 RepID=UPI003AF62352
MQTIKTKSQTEQIKEWLEDGLSLTRIEAFKQGFGLNLPARINDLKKQGLKIDWEPVEGTRERRYFIVGKHNAN